MKASLITLATVLAIAPTCALAQDLSDKTPPSPEDAASLPAIRAGTSSTVRSITSAPLNSTTLRGDRIEPRTTGSSDTGEILGDVPGVSVRTGGGFSSMPAIRGLTEQRLRILVDGIPIDAACPNDMNAPLSYTDPATIASIAVVPGVSPVSMGGDHIGGVIKVESSPPRFAMGDETLVTGKASTFYRSNGDGFGGSASLTVADRNLSVTYTGSYTRSDNYEGGGDKGVVRSSEFAKFDHALSIAARTSAGLLELKGGYQFSPYEGFVNQYMDMTENRSWFASARYKGVYGWGDLELSASYRDTDHEMGFLADKQPGDMPMNTETHTFTAAAKADIVLSRRDTLRVGADIHHLWLDDYWPPVAGSAMMGPDPFVNINGADRDRYGVFGEWEAQWSDRFATSIGVRFDRVEMNTGDVQPYGTGMMQMADVAAAAAFNAADRKRRDNNWSATALASWALSDDFSAELGYAHKARSPNVYERYTWGRGAMASRMIGWYGDGNGYVGNIDLDPERADTVSAALRYAGADGTTFKVSPYYTRMNDYIDAQLLQPLTDMMGMPTGFVQLRFANQDAEFYGVDASAVIPLAQGQNSKTVLSADAAWVHGRNLTDGGALYHQMPLNGSVSLDHVTGPLELRAQVELVAEKTRVDATRNEPRTDGYALVNLRAAYTLESVFKGVKLALEAQNLFDKGYDLPLGGMSLGDFDATGNLRPVPGRGRSINVSLSTSF